MIGSCRSASRVFLVLICVVAGYLVCAPRSAAQTTATKLAAPSAPQSGPQKQLQTPVPSSTALSGGQIIRAIFILMLFIVLAGLIAARKLPAMIALPVMAFGIGLIAGVPLLKPGGIIPEILEGSKSPPSGAFRLYSSIVWVIVGGMFARFISDAGIAERIVKYTAEFAGEDPFFVSLLMSIVTAIVFTASGGLPMIIMLGTVMFPILLSLGVPPVTAGGLMMLSFPIGAALQPGGWGFTAQAFDVPLEQVRTFFLVWAAVQTLVLLIFLSVEFLRMKRSPVRPVAIARSVAMVLVPVLLLLLVASLHLLAPHVPDSQRAEFERILAVRSQAWYWLKLAMKVGVAALLIAGVAMSQWKYRKAGASTNWNLLTPILPLLFVLLFGFKEAIIPAFLASMLYGVLTTPRPRSVQRLGKSIIDGVSDVAAPVVLMIGIGMLVAAATHEDVKGILSPILASVVPTTPLPYILFFIAASPLALYRGPLNVWGLGIGIGKLLQNFLPNGAVMGAMHSVGMLVDPTTTQNIWICGYLKLDINALLFKLIAYSLGMCVIGLVLSVFMFF